MQFLNDDDHDFFLSKEKKKTAQNYLPCMKK